VGGPKLVCIDLETNEILQAVVMPPDVALETTYLDDVRFDLRRGESGAAYITDSSGSGPNGIIVVDLDTSEAWRRLHDHPSTKAAPLSQCRPIVEGRPFLERPAAGEPQPVTRGADGVAISGDGERLWYCPMAGRHWYSVSTAALFDRSVPDADVAATVIDEGDKGGVGDGLDDQGREQVLDLVAGQRDQPGRWWVADALEQGGHDQEGVGEHRQGGPAVPGASAADLMLVWADQALAGLEALLDGLIANGKFCCTRRVWLRLTWWHRPLRLRGSELETDAVPVGAPHDPDLDCLPPAQPPPRRRPPLGSGLPAAGALDGRRMRRHRIGGADGTGGA